MKQIIGQIDLYSYWLENFSYGAKCRREGYTNVYDKMPDHPCKVDVIDHEGNRFRTDAVLSFGSIVFKTCKNDYGYGICWWKEVKG